ncbi:MAG: PQQ-binding-like beta-propeller repeat protein [Planctomycetota bacterium]
MTENPYAKTADASPAPQAVEDASDGQRSVDADGVAGPLQAGSEQAGSKQTRSLRWWPAVLIVAAMLGLRYLPGLAAEPSLGLMMLRFMGPGLTSLLVLVWWLGFSRASGREKLVGTAGLLLIALVTMGLAHWSMVGMGMLLFQIPFGIGVFAITLALCASLPTRRLIIGLAATLLAFGFWDAVRLEGTTGAFDFDFAWRFSTSDEDEYLEQLERNTSDPVLADTGDGVQIQAEQAAWSEFRGPNRDGVLPGVRLLSDWDAHPPMEIWRRRLGPGWGSFSVAAGRLFTQEQRGDNEAVICLDAETGNTIWEYEYLGRFEESIAGAGPRATPTIGSNTVYCQGASGVVVALDAITGKEIWSVKFQDLAQREAPTWGWSSSPLVVPKETGGDRHVIVYAGGEDDLGLFALDAANGDVVWSAPAGEHTYSSPQWATFHSIRGVLFVDNKQLMFFNPNDGSRYWDFEWDAQNYRVIQPQQVGSEVLFATPLNTGAKLVRVDSGDADGEFQVSEVWDSTMVRSAYNDWVYHEGYLYGFDNSIFACADWKTGDRKWKRGRYGAGQVLLLPDADQLLVIGEKGELVLLEANPEKLVEIAKTDVLDGKTWNHPVMVGDRLYVRNGREAACFTMPIQVTMADSPPLENEDTGQSPAL